MMQFYRQKCINIQVNQENWSYFLFISFTLNKPYLSQNGYRIHKSWFNRSFGITIKQFIKQNNSLCCLHEKIGNTNKKYCLHIKREKLTISS